MLNNYTLTRYQSVSHTTKSIRCDLMLLDTAYEVALI
jgi:hypothetical protein